MTARISPQQAMDAVSAARPQPATIDREWHIGRRERVLSGVLAAPRAGTPGAASTAVSSAGGTPGAASSAVSSSGGTPHSRAPGGRRPRWALLAAAAAVLVVVGLVAQVTAPLGRPGSPQSASALNRLAAAVPQAPTITAGAYELTVYEESGISGPDKGPFHYATERSTWTAPDGWSWADQTGYGAAHFIFRPAPKNYDLNTVPADPAVMEAYLRALVGGSTSAEEALFEAVRATLAFTPTPVDTRVAAIRMLARVTGVTVVEATTDPLGRPATRVDFVDDRHRPGLVNSIFLDPDTTQLLAQLKTENGRPIYTCLFTERRLVGQLPDDIRAVLGSERIEKIVHP